MVTKNKIEPSDTMNSLAAIVIVLVGKSGGRITLRRDELEKVVKDLEDGYGMTVRRDPDGDEWISVTLEYPRGGE